MKNEKSSPVIYREYLRPSINTFASAAILGPTLWLTFFKLDATLGIWLGVLGSLGLLALALLRAPTIVVTADELRAGAVSIPRAELGRATALSGDAARLARGPELDARAHVLYRGTTAKLVRIELRSELDSTPYWLISSRRPTELAEALNSR